MSLPLPFFVLASQIWYIFLDTSYILTIDFSTVDQPVHLYGQVRINFHKSEVIPMNLDQAQIHEISHILATV